MTVPLHIFISRAQGFPFLHTSPVLVTSYLFENCHHNTWSLIVVLVRFFLVTSDGKHHFRHLLAICMSP